MSRPGVLAWSQWVFPTLRTTVYSLVDSLKLPVVVQMSHHCKVSGLKTKRMRLKALSGLLPSPPCAHIGDCD